MNTHAWMNGIVDGRVVQVRLPISVIEKLFPTPEPEPAPRINALFDIGDRVKPMGWTSDKTGEAPIATVVGVTADGVEVHFGPEVTGDGTTVPFHFVNECVELV